MNSEFVSSQTNPSASGPAIHAGSPNRKKSLSERNLLLLFSLTALAGFLIGFFWIGKTGWLTAADHAPDLSVCSGWYEVVYLFLRGYYAALKYLIIIFAVGFTIFSPAISTAILIWRGLAAGVSAYAASASGFGFEYVLMTLYYSLLLFLYVLMAVESMCYQRIGGHSSTLRELISSRNALSYTARFLVLASALLALRVLYCTGGIFC